MKDAPEPKIAKKQVEDSPRQPSTEDKIQQFLRSEFGMSKFGVTMAMQFLRNYVASTGHDVVVLTPGMECMVGGEDSDSESKSSVETDDESVVAIGADDDVATTKIGEHGG